jgi:pyruvate dehydrogenase E2 component (dihydrolipoamide acetyltransferase)
MPKLGDTMEEGKILRWLKQEGDTVKKGDALAEIETEKVNIEVESFFAGTLRKILVPAGETMAVGAPIALVGAANEALPAAANATQASAPAAQPVAAAAPAAQTAQAAPATPSTPAQPQIPASGNGHVAAPFATGETGGRIFISPIARHIAAEHNLDIAQIQGTGPGGRIIRADVEAALARQESGQPAAAAQAAPVEAVALSQMRKTIAKRLQQSMQTAPHFYVTMTIDTTRLGEFRNAVNEYAATLPQPVKVSFNDLIVKAVATALTHMPEVNVSFDGERLLFKKAINVGVAVALPEGLIVPVVRDADKRGVLDIARESKRLVDAARAGKLKPEDFSGGTFSVSNLGMFGVDEFTAIINPPESAILAVGAIVPTPVVANGQVVVRDQMKVTLSVDHRALDGAVAARFLQDLKRLLEQPLGMLL